MKKIVCLGIITVLLMGILAGCSSGPTEEELRAQVEAEMAAEAELEAQIRAEIEAEMAAEAEDKAQADGEADTSEHNGTESGETVGTDTSENNGEVGADTDAGGDTVSEEEPQPEEIIWLEGIGIDIKVVASALNVREGASTDDAIVGTVNAGDVLEIIESAQDSDRDYLDWHKVQLEDGTVGWVAGWHCVVEYGYDTPAGRENLEGAFKGKIDGIETSIGDDVTALLDELDLPEYSDLDDDGSVSINYSCNFLIFKVDIGHIGNYVDNIEEQSGEISAIKLSTAFFNDDDDIYGVEFGMTPFEVINLLDGPNYSISEIPSEEGLRSVMWDVYVLGQYSFVVQYATNDEPKVIGISLAKDVEDLYY